MLILKNNSKPTPHHNPRMQKPYKNRRDSLKNDNQLPIISKEKSLGKWR